MQLTRYHFIFILMAVFSIILLYYYSYFVSFVFETSSLKNKHQPKIQNCSPASGLQVTIEKSNDNVDYDFFDFEGFDNNDNKTNLTKIIVPNIVHLIVLNSTFIKFYQMVNIFSIFLNNRPSKIFIHCNNCSFYGPYWEQILQVDELIKIIHFKQVVYHHTIYGVYTEVIQHVSDFLRLLVLAAYGGIYLDNDVYVAGSFDEYRVYELSVGWDDDNLSIGNQVFIANRNSRFLRYMIDAFRTNFTLNAEWYFAGDFMTPLLRKNRTLAHREYYRLGIHMLVHELYKTYWEEWKTYTCMHLLINHRSYLDEESPIKDFNETNIQNYNYTYGYMVRDVLDRIKPYFNKEFKV